MTNGKNVLRKNEIGRQNERIQRKEANGKFSSGKMIFEMFREGSFSFIYILFTFHWKVMLETEMCF